MKAPKGLPAEQAEAIFSSALAPGAWAGLTARERNRLRRRWAAELGGYTVAQLQQFAAAAPRQPVLVADGALHLKLVSADVVPADKLQDLEEFIHFCNVHRQLVCHGVDLKGIHLLTELATLRRHEVVLGISGMGKSTYMARLFCQLAAYRTPMVLIDQEKILLEDFLSHLPPERHGDVVIIDPSDMERSWGINLVQFARRFLDEADPQYASKVEYLNDRLASEITAALAVLQLDTAGYSPGPHVREAINNLLLAAVEHENTNMTDVHALLTLPTIRDQVASGVTRETVRNWLQYDLKAYDQAKIDGVRNKIHPFLRRVMINTFSRRDSCISIEQLLEQNKVIVLDLDSTKLSKPISRLIGYMFLILLRITLEHRYSKAVDEGRLGELLPCYIMVDEFRNFASSSTVDLLTEGRKRQAAVIVGLQSLDQIADDIANALYNVSTWTVFNSGPDDAARICRLFGYTNRLGNPRLEEITGLPKHVAKLRYEATHQTEGMSPHNFHAVTLKAYEPLPPNPRGREILSQMREASRRDYYKPNTEDDTRTIYDANDQTNDHVLRAIWDANIAVRRPTEYWLAGREHLARDGAAGHFVSQALIRAVLEARGMPVTKERVAQSIRYLKARRLVATDALSSGFKTNRLTTEGLRALELQVSPGTSSNEGGDAHRRAVQRAFVAFSQLGALPLHVPDQRTDENLPDLTIDSLPPVLLAALELPNHSGPFHVQVEVATARHRDRMAENVLNALAANAFPVLILPTASAASSVEAGLAAAALTGSNGIIEEAMKRFKMVWAGFVLDSKDRLEPARPQPLAEQRALRTEVLAQVANYLSLTPGPPALPELLAHLRSKGLIAEEAEVVAALQECGASPATPT